MTDDNNPLYPFYRDGKFGFFNRDFKEVIPPIYLSGNPHQGELGNFSDGFALVRRTDFRYVFIDKQGVELGANWYQKNQMTKGFFSMLNQNGWGFMDTAGKNQPREFSEGLAAIQDPAGWGFIDTTGKLVIEPQFEFVESFSDGLARVSVYKDGVTVYAGTINRQGEFVFKQDFQNVAKFYEGLAAAKYNNQWGYINTKGEWAIEPIYDFVSRFSEGLGGVEVNDEVGFVDVSGKIVIRPKFKLVSPFKDGLAIFETKTYGLRAAGVINRQGEVVVEPNFSRIVWFSEGLASAYELPPPNDPEREMLCGAIDATGQYVISPQFSYIGKFQNGLAHVTFSKMNKQEKNTCYIDQTGRVVWDGLKK
jgi:hypothetical protein